MLKEWSKRSNDAILSFGERLSTIVLFHRAHERGMEAELFDSRELVKTDDNFTAAVPIEDLTNRLISSRVRTQAGHGGHPAGVHRLHDRRGHHDAGPRRLGLHGHHRRRRRCGRRRCRSGPT